MRTIKIFLASSSELKEERIAFGKFIQQLDDIYESRGMRIKLIKWEFLDAADKNMRKQDEYYEHVRHCDMFIALFSTKVGRYTREELEVVLEENKKKGSPKIYVFCKACNKKDTDELKNLKKYLNEKGCFWYNFENLDNLKMQFVLQLVLSESLLPQLHVEDGNVRLGEVEIAKMDHLTFMVNNEQYQQLNKRVAELPQQIAIARQRAEKYPDDESFRDDLQRMLNEFNRLKETIKQEQNFLLETAIRISKLQGEKITGRTQRAITAFEDGDVHKANTILDEAEKDAKSNLDTLRQNIVITEGSRQNVIQSIEELLLQILIVKANTTIPIEERITQIKRLYQSTDQIAEGIGYEKDKYADFLLNYARFLYYYADYNKAKEVYLRQIPLSEEIFGTDHPYTATSYNDIGLVYKSLGNYDKALEYYRMALKIREKTLEKEHPDTATSYNDIGQVYDSLGDYDKALEYYRMALEIREEALGMEHPDTATSYNDIGLVYHSRADYDKALKYNTMALNVRKKALGMEHPDTATSYNDIGLVYHSQGDYGKALEYLQMALEIRERTLGKEHPDTATSYNDIGLVYHSQADYDKALKYNMMALEIRERTLGMEHPDTATSYNDIGLVYHSQADYDKALKYNMMALEIRERMLGREHPDTATSYNNIGQVYDSLGDYDKALEYYRMALEIREEALGMEHPDTATSYNDIGLVYHSRADYDKALKYNMMALEIRERMLGREHPDTATSYNDIGLVYHSQGDYGKALEYLQMALEIDENVLGKGHPDTAIDYNNIGLVYNRQGDYGKALEYLQMALEIDENVLGKDHPDTAIDYNNIGLVYKNQGDYDKALEYYRMALEIKEKALGKDHPSTAISYNNVGLVYYCQGFYENALEYYRMVLEIRESALGKDHPDTATSYNNIAGVYDSLGNYDKALEYYRMAQKVFKKSLGKEHPKTVALQLVINNLQHIIDNLSKPTTNYDEIKQDKQPLTYIIPDKDSNLISIDLNQMWFDGAIEEETIDLFKHVLSNPKYIFTVSRNNKKKDNDFWTAFYGTQNLDKEPDHLKDVNDLSDDLKSIYILLAYILMRKDAFDILCDSNPSNLRGEVDNSSKNSDTILFNAFDKGKGQLHYNKPYSFSYDNSKALRSPEFGKCLKRLLFYRLINKYSVYYPNIQFNDDVFYGICTKLGYEQVLGIEPETFKNWLEGRLYIEYINEVIIKNFLCIDNISIKFNESKEVYFLGENGDGKTLILYAIYLAFAGNWIKTLPEYAGIAIAILRDAIIEGTTLNGFDLIKTAYGKDQTTEMRKIYAYGTHRGRVNSIDNAEKYGFMTLFDANQTLVSPSEWIKDFCFREMMSQSEKSDNQSPIDISGLVESRKNALENLFNIILDKEVRVEFDDQDNYRVKYIENGAKLTFEQLSEGYRTTIIFICDLLYRLFEQRPKDDIIHGEDATGVVLIDEIDEHLHPRWQRTIVSRLRSLFPNIQFIFTTHSPHIIQGAGQDAVIYRLYRDENGKTCASDPFYRKDLDYMMMNTLTTSPLFNMDDARLDSNNVDADTSDSYLMYRIEQLVTEKIKDIKHEFKEEYMSPQQIDKLIKEAKEMSLDSSNK